MTPVVSLAAGLPSGIGLVGWFDPAIRILAGTVVLLLVTLWVVLLLRRRHDRCLELLREFPVEVELRDGSKLRGRVRVYGTGLVLHPVGPGEAHGEEGAGPPHSTILYREEWGRIRQLRCVPGDLNEADRKRRNARLRGLLGGFGFGREANLGRIRALLVALDGLLPRRAAAARVAPARPDALHVPTPSGPPAPTVTQFDRLLESLRGAAVTVERTEPEPQPTVTGVLVDYSSEFLLLGGVKSTGEEIVTVPMSGRKTVPGLAEVHREGARVTLRNLARDAVEILRVESFTYLVPIGRSVDPGKTVLLELKNAQIPLLSLVLRVRRDVDVMLPRTTSRIRQSAAGPADGWEALLDEEPVIRPSPGAETVTVVTGPAEALPPGGTPPERSLPSSTGDPQVGTRRPPG